VSSTPAHAAPDALIAPTTTNYFVAAVILALFVLAAVLGALRKDITQGFDEVAHTSYAAEIQRTHDIWPRLETLRLLDPKTFQFTGEASYLNHPPIFYVLQAWLGPALEGRPAALLAHRLIDVGIAAIGFAVLLGLGIAAGLPRLEFYAYAVPLACIPVLTAIAGAVNNDNLAFLGGALTALGLWQALATGRFGWFTLALIGVVAAGWAKLTGLMLTAGMAGSAAAYLFWRGRLRWTWLAAAAFAFTLAAAPYFAFILQYGSPTPNTPAQIALLTDGARGAGWIDLPRKSFSAYALNFVADFITDWMPALGPRSDLNYAMLAVPVAAVGCAIAGVALSLRRLCRGEETPLDVMVISSALAFAAAFAIHISYSYGRHLATGWLMDAYPRYYLPLAAFVPLAGLSLLGAIEAQRWRAGLLGFLVAGPILFRILGAPLG
jgi:hypothetical protein